MAEKFGKSNEVKTFQDSAPGEKIFRDKFGKIVIDPTTTNKTRAVSIDPMQYKSMMRMKAKDPYLAELKL